MIRVSSLKDTSIHSIVNCFNLAFEKYMIKMPTDVPYYQKRWEAAFVDYEYSFGVFDGDLLAGFIINGIDDRGGFKVAFNSGTGVLPAYRGMKLVHKIYDSAIPILKSVGIKKLCLEVITTNDIAIRAYERIGFKICKEYKCYKGGTEPPLSHFSEVITQQINPVDWDTYPNQSFYCWDHYPESMQRGDYEHYLIKKEDGRNLGFFFINKEKEALAQFDVFEQDEMHWTTLFSEVAKISPDFKLNNIDSRLSSKIKAIERLGLENYIDQYVMEMNI